MDHEEQLKFSGIAVSAEELDLIRETVKDCSGLSRTELAHTMCELLDWRRPNGGLKAHECRIFLEELDARGILELPGRRVGKPGGAKKFKAKGLSSEPTPDPLLGSVKEFGPVRLEKVEDKEGRALWRDWIGRYHYLGFAVPFGAHLKYFVRLSKPEPTRVGCVQLSSPAWRMAVRDGWIGWNEAQKERRLQWIVQNSRFLILPWVQIANLASTTLSVLARQCPQDWEERYAIRPVLMETLVDSARYRGTCYRAANWIHLGTTTGRGRMDRAHERHGAEPKEVFVYPLTRNARKQLLESLSP